MCLILFSYQKHPYYQLVLAANRDEFYSRPTAPLGFRDEARQILSGRDLMHNGTWLGMTKTGRLAAITNFRDPATTVENAPSRGHLVSDFLISDEPSKDYLEKIKSTRKQYNGFNIIVGDFAGLYYYSNRENIIQAISPGVHGLSNKFLDTPWPKIEKGKAYLNEIIDANDKINPEDLFSILKDHAYPPFQMLPNTGVGPCWEKVLSPLFISSKNYGTRSSSIILMEKTGKTTFLERTFVAGDSGPEEENTREFSFIVSI
jgi:uncharacterized protein with NRDE domain